MNKIVLGICILMIGCNKDSSQETLTASEMQYTPEGSKFIKDHGQRWTEWELDGNCFFSYNLKGRTGLLTSIPCKNKQFKDN